MSIEKVAKSQMILHIHFCTPRVNTLDLQNQKMLCVMFVDWPMIRLHK